MCGVCNKLLNFFSNLATDCVPVSGEDPLCCPENKLVKLDLEPAERVSSLTGLLVERERRKTRERVTARHSVAAIKRPVVGHVLHRLSRGRGGGGGGGREGWGEEGEGRDGGREGEGRDGGRRGKGGMGGGGGREGWGEEGEGRDGGREGEWREGGREGWGEGEEGEGRDGGRGKGGMGGGGGGTRSEGGENKS